jgi:pimeloyl-ACP methyl ester carboxylesterase
VAVIALAYLSQERMMFYPTTLEPKYKFQLSLPAEEKFTDTGNEVVHSLLVKAPQPKGLVLFFHGNAGNLREWASVAQELAMRVHWDVWMVDYPGYGKSTGSIQSQEQLLNSVRRVYAQAKTEFPKQKIVLFGRSIGSGIAVKIAAENSVQGLVLETPYLSISRLTHNMYPWIPLFALKYPLPSEEWILQVKAPILALHGDQDEIIPFEHGSKLSSLSPHATFVRIPEGRHNNLAIFDLYWSSIEAFFKGLAG